MENELTCMISSESADCKNTRDKIKCEKGCYINTYCTTSSEKVNSTCRSVVPHQCQISLFVWSLGRHHFCAKLSG